MSKIKILGYDYEVTNDRDSGSIDAFGTFCAKSQIIQIASNIGKQQSQSVLLHEIIEALDFHLELKLRHQNITALESGLYQTLVDNGVDLSPLTAIIEAEAHQ